MSYQVFDDFHDPSASTFDTLLGSLQYDEVRGGTGTWEADYDSTVLCSDVVNQLRERVGEGEGGREGKGVCVQVNKNSHVYIYILC